MHAKAAGVTLKPEHSAGADPSRSAKHEFTHFAVAAEPRLRRALLGAVGVDRMPDAVGEALAYGWQHWDDVREMTNPVGYLYRVGQSKVRVPKPPRLFRERSVELPDVEPGLTDAMLRLPQSQRTALWLAYGCQWTRAEVGEALGISASTVGNHIDRGLQKMRQEMGADRD